MCVGVCVCIIISASVHVCVRVCAYQNNAYLILSEQEAYTAPDMETP